MIILTLALFVLWIYLLTVLTRAKLYFFKYVVGAIGLFFFIMFYLESYLTLPIGHAVASVAGVLGNITNMYQAYPRYSLIFISRQKSFISFYIDYECSGTIEIYAFSCLLWFFPLYNTFEKVLINLAGIVWIFLANVLRIFIICLLIYCFGNNIFYFAHTVFGRIVFYGFSIVLYFYVFTKPHVLRQKVGQVTYGDTIHHNI